MPGRRNEPERDHTRGSASPRGREARRGGHPFRRLLGRARVVVQSIVVAILFLILSGTLFAVITGAIGFGPGDDGFTGWVGLLLLLNVAAAWLYGKHLRWKSPYWPS